eukprot:TRINITY_DN20669_c0_g1_i1.p1 TRINITY_DN20669_c0_g1~~TRINITY_DN20669_c0_g1_i1.p1  ORF type:complete len:172 (+),score=12.94 TRINITY_DN20669_c0_g1_i1:94-609(+)
MADGEPPVSESIETKDPAEFHAEWMQRVHRRIITTVDSKLAAEVDAMERETVPALYYPGKPGTFPLESLPRDMPPTFSMWFPSHGAAKVMQWRIGGRTPWQTPRMHAGEKGPETRVTVGHGMKNTAGGAPRSPWSLPAKYKTTPIPSMHIQGASRLAGLRCLAPLGLRLVL